MCNAKLFLCGVIALVLVMGALLCRTRAVAAQRAEAERMQAEEAERRAKAERLLRQEADDVRQGLGPNLEKALDRLAALRDKAREGFNAERQELMVRLKRLEVQERETMAKIEAEANELQRHQNRRASPVGDKLDRILERLDSIEQRLERLERSGSSPGGKK